MAPLCREFGISRVTGHKIFERYKDCGLNDWSRHSFVTPRRSSYRPYRELAAPRMNVGFQNKLATR
ncbi:hypothetical protein FJ695_22895 [Labrenzia sp. PHM005]|nr:hypothetical protein FJ695_22895 [Labrenzia sp. PHM005]